MYDKRTVFIGKQEIKPERGVMQGSLLSPFLFNVYLEHAMKDNAKLKSMIQRGDLFGYADDVAMLTWSVEDLEVTLREYEKI